MTAPLPPATTTPDSTRYDPTTLEAEIYALWLREKSFAADPSAPGEPYTIVIPPPNVTGALHLGHALDNTLQDILIRRARMQGKNALWVPGIDHAGIATQAVVEKQLKENENKTRHDVGREALVARIWEWKQQYGDRILMQLQRLGCSCDWDRTRFTLDEMCAKAVRETFFKLFRDGLIFRGKRLVNWDIHLQTSISDDELYDEAVKTSMWHIKYPIDGTDKHMVVATTRPETMLADTAVAVHPDDPRWNWAIGKFVKLPLTGRLIPIIGDPILVDMAFGSGAVKVTPAHDPNDYAVWQRQAGAIEIKNLMTPDGKVNAEDPSWAAYAGLRFNDARKKVVEDLIAGGFMTEEDIKPHEANVKFSDRSKTAIQPYLSDQWYVKMAPLAESAMQVVKDDMVKFFPARHAQQYLAWLGEKRDWPISRQLWWGHRIPVWSKTEPAAKHGISADQRISNIRHQSDPGDQSGDSAVYHPFGPTKGLETQSVTDDANKSVTTFRCVGNLEEPQRTALIASLELDGFVQDPDVLDTWFSSGLWPHSTLGWPEKTAELAKYYPTSVLVTGRDIITLWVARMVMTGIYNNADAAVLSESLSSAESLLTPAGAAAAVSDWQAAASKAVVNDGLPTSAQRDVAKRIGLPFNHVCIHPTILDGKGERMSKSKGNGVDPVEIIDTHGADAMRLTLATMATETQDVRMPVKKDAQGRNTSDKFELGRNFCTKLWNASRFILSSIDVAQNPLAKADAAVDDSKWTLADKWIVSRFNRTVAAADEAIATYRFDHYAKSVYDFFWNDLCNWHIESAKLSLRDENHAAQTAHVLTAMLDGTLRLLHPITPFITEAIWSKLNAARPNRPVWHGLPASVSPLLVKTPWPTAGKTFEDAEHVFPRLQEVIGTIRNVRNEYKVDASKVVTVSLAPPGDEAAQAVLANRELVERLALCKLNQVQPGLPQPVNSARGTMNGCDIYVENLVDPEAEKARTAKRCEELTKSIASMEQRLASPNYADKAPAHLVAQTRQQLEDAKTELAKLK